MGQSRLQQAGHVGARGSRWGARAPGHVAGAAGQQPCAPAPAVGALVEGHRSASGAGVGRDPSGRRRGPSPGARLAAAAAGRGRASSSSAAAGAHAGAPRRRCRCASEQGVAHLCCVLGTGTPRRAARPPAARPAGAPAAATARAGCPSPREPGTSALPLNSRGRRRGLRRGRARKYSTPTVATAAVEAAGRVARRSVLSQGAARRLSCGRSAAPP
jgi:hypothetical protein